VRNISRTLGGLPETLDETYERILQGIPKEMWKDAHCILQWLTVSSRPLRVEEVAEVFAINFDEEMSGIPKFDPSWRDPNAETAVLSACSTLVAIVDDRWGGNKIVQFSHFSVQEYLTSDRIANAEHVSHFHIHPKPAHTLLAKTCLSVLCQLDYSIDRDKIKNFSLAEYAAEHWVEHARFEDVSSYIRDGMDLLFEKDKPHLAAWIWVPRYNIDDGRTYYGQTAHPGQPGAVPLYYAALCGFGGLVERLLTAHPQDLNAKGGVWGSPLNAALAKGHLNIALFLLGRGADGENRSKADQNTLYIASSRGHTDVVRSLIDRGADLNVESKGFDMYDNEVQWTPLHVASFKGKTPVTRILLEHGANPNAPNNLGATALHSASSSGEVTDVEVLLEYGANVNVRNEWGWTPLHDAAYHLNLQVVEVLLNHGADPHALTNFGKIPIQLANVPRRKTSKEDQAQIIRLLSEHTGERM